MSAIVIVKLYLLLQQILLLNSFFYPQSMDSNLFNSTPGNRLQPDPTRVIFLEESE